MQGLTERETESESGKEDWEINRLTQSRKNRDTFKFQKNIQKGENKVYYPNLFPKKQRGKNV